MYARYKSQNGATLSYMEDAFHRFHTFKDNFLLRHDGKKANPKPNTLRTKLLKKQKVDEETNAVTCQLSMMGREINTWRDYISHEIDVSKVLDAYFNFPMIHISNNRSFRLKHPGVPDGSDGSDGTSYPLTENYRLPVAQATGRVA
jgi:hypothetical protein